MIKINQTKDKKLNVQLQNYHIYKKSHLKDKLQLLHQILKEKGVIQ